MNTLKILGTALVGVVLLPLSSQATSAIINPGFETPLSGGAVFNPNPGYVITNENNVSGWRTEASDNAIELWQSGFAGNGIPIFASTGSGELNGGQIFAELNANVASNLYQDVQITDLGAVDFFFLHRGRNSSTIADVAKVTITFLGANNAIGGSDDVVAYDGNFSATNVAWVFNSVDNAFSITSDGTYKTGFYRFNFSAVSSTPNTSNGNFIDNVGFGVDVVPEPSTVVLTVIGACSALFFRRRKTTRC